jgi:hypothetical protein
MFSPQSCILREKLLGLGLKSPADSREVVDEISEEVREDWQKGLVMNHHWE